MQSIQAKMEVAESVFGDNPVQFFYGLRARPFSIGAQPNGQTLYLTSEEAEHLFPDAGFNVRHGALGYRDALPEHEIRQYELVDLNKAKPRELTDDDIKDYVRVVAYAVYMDRIGVVDTVHADLVGMANDCLRGEIPAGWRHHVDFVNRKTEPEAFERLKQAWEMATPDMYLAALEDVFGINP